MKKAYLKELQSQLLGNVTDHPEVLEYFSTDDSIFQVMPTAIVYPKNTADVRKTVHFAAERTAAGKPLSITARGRGSDQGGGAVGEGLQVVFPAHMDKLLRLDRDTVTVQPGILYHTLQQTLHTHGRFLPPYPTSSHYSTIGGAVANDAAGEKSVKYGTTRHFVKKLKVVLADGSLIETRRLSARELNHKKGQADFEGEIYRKLDNLLLDHAELIAQHRPKTTKYATGYALSQVRGPGGTFDLTPLFVGAQGTLGLITEVTLQTVPYNPRTTLVVGYFDSFEKLGQALEKLRPLKPSALEMVDRHVLEYAQTHHLADLQGLVPDRAPRAVLLVEFDDLSQFKQRLKSTRAARIMDRAEATVRLARDPVEQMALWKIRHVPATIMWMNHGSKKAIPFIEDAIVPVEQLVTFLHKSQKLLERYELEPAVWGHVGEGHVHFQPFLDLTKKKEVDKLFEVAQEFYQLVASLHGLPSGEHNDGLLRGPYLQTFFGEEMMEVFAATKHILDPLDILNPLKKNQATEAYVRAHLRTQYSPKPLYEHVFYT